VHCHGAHCRWPKGERDAAPAEGERCIQGRRISYSFTMPSVYFARLFITTMSSLAYVLMLYRIKSTHSSVKLRNALVGRIGIFHKLPKYSIDTWTDEPGITVGVSVEERKMDRKYPP
jgi:hypothetical protein